MSDDETRAADALVALQSIDTDKMDYKAEVMPAVLDIENRDVTMLFSLDSLDSVNDITEVSAFKKSTLERPDRIAHLYFHDLKTAPIARILEFHPLRKKDLPVDVQTEYPTATGGMACTSRYNKAGLGNDVFDGYTNGIAYQASFGYQVLTSHKEILPDGRKARRIKELRLFEVSTVPPGGFAAHPGTRTMRLNKAFDLILDLEAEYKAGWRHGTHDDMTRLHKMRAILDELLGIDSEPREAEPSAFAALTSDVDDVLSEVAHILEAAP